VTRGTQGREGATRVAPNGYHYTRTKSKWRLTHHLVVEESLGRPLKPKERVYFIDGDRNNLDPDNLLVKEAVNTKEKRIRDLEARIARDRAELRELKNEV
jgi:hypothetical protein